jgi:hypothetical protein
MAENQLSRREFFPRAASAIAVPSLVNLLSEEAKAQKRRIHIERMPIPRFHIHAAPYPYRSFTHMQWVSPNGLVFNSYIPANNFAGGRNANVVGIDRTQRIFREHRNSNKIPGLPDVFSYNHFSDSNPRNGFSEKREFKGLDKDCFQNDESLFLGMNPDLTTDRGCLATFEIYRKSGSEWKYVDGNAQVVQAHRIPCLPLDVTCLTDNHGGGEYCVTGTIGGREVKGRTVGGRKIGESKFRLAGTISAVGHRLASNKLPIKPETPDDFGVSNFKGYSLFSCQGAVESNGKEGIQIGEYLQVNRDGGYPSDEPFDIVFANYGTNNGRDMKFKLFSINKEKYIASRKFDLAPGKISHIPFKSGDLSEGPYSMSMELPNGSALIDSFNIRKPRK